MTEKVFIYDTTLRDGTQGEGFSLSLNDKLKIAERLDAFGVDYIEGGWPGSNPKDAEFFDAVKKMEFKHAKVAAFGSTRRKNSKTEDDANIKALVDAETPVVTLVGKSWDLHVHDVLGTDLEENLEMISDSVGYLKGLGKEVVYDAEHFFDGYKANPEYALMTLKVAAEAGADCVVLCETNGGCMPWEVAEIVEVVSAELSNTATQIGIHTHDDSGCAVANSLAAIKVGAVHVQGTINGVGERVGNANLCTIIPDLQLKMNKACVSDEALRSMTDLSRYVTELANLPHNNQLPYVGASAFAHKGGIHVAAMRKNPLSYQHAEPSVVGNEQRTLVSELSGRGNIFDKATEFGVDVDGDEAKVVLDQIKQLESEGFAFEAGEASMSLLLHRAKKGYSRPFEVEDFTTWISRRDDEMVSDASVKIRIDGELFHTAASGNGPVNALSMALRKAIFTKYPNLQTIHLTDYKVRILDGENGTEARTRVLIDFINEATDERWSTVGASPNIIEASWRALTDSYEFALLKK